MEEIKHFLQNYQAYMAGDIVHDDIASVLIKKYML